MMPAGLRRLGGLVVLLGGAAAASGEDALVVPDGSADAGESVLLPVSVAGESAVVAMQFDLRFTKAVVDVLGPVAAGGSNHRVLSREVSEGVRRVVVYSRSNALLPKDVVIDVPMVMAEGVAGRPSPSLRIEGLCFALEDGSKVKPAIRRGPVDTWFAEHFSAAELEVPSIYGDDSDPDGDGLVNLMELGVGGSPWVRDDGLLPVVTMEAGPGGEDFMMMRYRQAKVADGVVVEPRISTDLVGWEVLEAVPTGEEDAATIEFAAGVERGEAARQFLRLSVRRAGP